MGSTTKIEWTDATWNPIIGCSRVSEGCRHCYAETIAGRFGGGKETVYSGLTHIVNGRAVWTGQIKETKKLLEPLSWRSPKRVFVNSMSDLFHENVTDELRDRIFAVMALAPKHTFQVLTKRPELMRNYINGFPANDPALRLEEAAARMCFEDEAVCALANWINGWSRWRDMPDDGNPLNGTVRRWPLPNVWLGVSVENQKAADERIPLLLQTPATVRFVSCEPLLGLIDFEAVPFVNTETLDWVICGGESGPGARPMHPDWARSLRDQCEDAGVAFFFKQWGEMYPCNDGDGFKRIGKKAAGALLDGREWKQFPEAR